MRRADRLFQIVQLLRSRRTVTARWLAVELEVSERTVYRDIQDLSRSGVPVHGEAGVGYALLAGYELPPMTFTPEEITALVAGARMVERWTDPELAAAARAAIRKIEAVVPSTMREKLQSTMIFAGPRFAQEPPNWLGPIRRAIDERLKLSISYVRSDGAASERTIAPLALYFWGSKWILGAWCDKRQDYRAFRPDRIVDLNTLAETFELSDDGISLQAFLRSAEAGYEPSDGQR